MVTNTSNGNPVAKALPHGAVAKILHWSTAPLLLFADIDNGDFTNALRDPGLGELTGAAG